MKAIKIFLFASLLISCNQSMDQKDIIRWFNDYDNGVHVKKSHGVYSFDLLYQAPIYLKAMNNLNEDPENHIAQFRLKIGLNGSDQNVLHFQSKNERERQSLLYYYNYEFQRSLKLIIDDEEYSCELFQFEKAIKKNGELNFTLGFPIPKKLERGKLIIDSPQISTIPINLAVHTQDIPEIH